MSLMLIAITACMRKSHDTFKRKDAIRAINYNRGLRVQAFLAFAPTGDLRFQRAWTWILSKSEKKSWGLPTRILPQPSKSTFPQGPNCLAASASRSEERRVGKEGVSTCRCRWWLDHYNTNTIQTKKCQLKTKTKK